MAVEDSAAARVAEIAALLKCPLETFFRPGDDGQTVNMTDELLRLWSMICEPQARQRVLTAARQEAALCESVVNAAE